MIKIIYTDGVPEIDRKAKDFDHIDDRYVLYYEGGKERHLQARQVRSIGHVDDDEGGDTQGTTVGPMGGGFNIA
jgi:hypothetical protein